MVETVVMIVAALLIAWGASAIDATPNQKHFTYPGSQIIREAQKDYHG